MIITTLGYQKVLYDVYIKNKTITESKVLVYITPKKVVIPPTQPTVIIH